MRSEKRARNSTNRQFRFAVESLEDRRLLTAASTPLHEMLDASPSADHHAALDQSTWVHPRLVDASQFDQPTPSRNLGVSFLSTNSNPDGDLPRDVEFSADGDSVWVVNRNTDNVVVFDADTRMVVEDIAVQDFPVDVAMSPDGRYAVVPNLLSDTVSIIDASSHTIAANVPISGTQPFRVDITADSGFAVVGVIDNAGSSALSIISLDTMSEVRSIPTVPQGAIGFFGNTENGISGNIYTKFAVSPDNATVVIPDRGNAQIALYDIHTGTETLLASTATPAGVDVSLDGTTAVVSHEFGEQAITVIDLVTQTVTDTLTTSDSLSSQAIRITPDKSHAIVAILNSVMFVDLSDGATTAILSTGGVGEIELSFDGQYAFVSNFNSRVIDINAQSIVRTLTQSASVEAAVSPVENRAVTLNNRFAEEVNFYNIDGATGFVEGFALSGTLPEGDATRTLGISGDGLTVVAGNNVSRNVSIIDLTTNSVRAYVDTGQRVLGVDVSADGTTAIAANAETNTVSVIDLGTDSVVAQVPVFTRPAEVLISPDNQMAYATTVAGTDRLHFIELNGAASAVTGSLITGQMGSAFGYSFSKSSGMAQSADGSILGLAISFDDELMLVDTATQTEFARVPLPSGSFPIDLTFSPDGTRVYVLNAFGDSVSVVEVNGAASNVITTIPGIDVPATAHVDAAGDYVYVGNSGNNPRISVIDTSTNSIVRNVPLGGAGPRAAHLSTTDSILRVASNSSNGSFFHRVAATGATSSVIDSVQLTSSAADLVYSESRKTSVVAEPIPDGVDLVFDVSCDFDGDGQCNVADIDLLVAGIVAGTNPTDLDLNADGLVNLADRDVWLSLAGEQNLGPGRAYLVADANLDGAVDGQDFISWNDNKFQANAAWSAGDFNADGFVDGQDFILWNDNKFQSADNISALRPSARPTTVEDHEEESPHDDSLPAFLWNL